MSGAGVWESARPQTLKEFALVWESCEGARLMMMPVWLMRRGEVERAASRALPGSRSHPAIVSVQ